MMDVQPPLLSQAFELLLAGMGTVFAFLILLVLATRTMSWLVLRYQPAPIAEDAEARGGPSAEELAAAAAAVHRYRREHSANHTR